MASADSARSHKVAFTGGPRQRKISLSSTQSSDIGVTRRSRKISVSSMMSTGRPTRRSMVHSERGAVAAYGGDWYLRKPSRIANTYKMTPNKPFSVSVSRKTIESELDQYLAGMTYDATEVGIKAKIISDHIKQMVKLHGFGRYKIICTVTLGQSGGQGFVESSRCLWDVEHDGFVTVSRDNGHVFVIVTVFALFHE